MSLHFAKTFAREYHGGQFRKKDHLPYLVHPERVVEILQRQGVEDEEVERVFGNRVAQGVYTKVP